MNKKQTKSDCETCVWKKKTYMLTSKFESCPKHSQNDEEYSEEEYIDRVLACRDCDFKNLKEISGWDFLEELLYRMNKQKIRYVIRMNKQTHHWEMLIEETETKSCITVDLKGMRSDNGTEIRWFNVFGREYGN